MVATSNVLRQLRTSVPTFFYHPVFQEAITDLAVLGISVSLAPTPGAEPYAVVGGRSNARWWLFPLRTGRLTASGLSLFQPVLSGARHMKTVASWLSRVHLQHLWARQKVYVSHGNAADRLYGGEGRSFAFFTGTNSPHRKVAVQIMNEGGSILGFAKLTRSLDVGALLMHEASVLQRLESIPMRAAAFPRVLRAERVHGATILVTDTLKTPTSRSAAELSAAHVRFVRELSQMTQGATRTLGAIEAEYRERVDRVRGRLSLAWRERLRRALEIFSPHSHEEVTTSMCHGDFTPSNAFFGEHGLYVFDWEYAASGALPGHDIAHFALNSTTSIALDPARRYQKARQLVSDTHEELRENLIDTCLVAYLISQCLRFIERSPTDVESIAGWEREEDHAGLLDAALSASASVQ